MLNKNIRRYMMCFCLFMSTSIIAGCDNQNKETAKPVVTQSKDSLKEPAVTASKEVSLNIGQDENLDIKDELINANNMKELPIYCITSDVSDKESVICMIPKDTEVVPKVITDCVVNEFTNQGLLIGIEEITKHEGEIIISFSADKAPVTGLGAGVEALVLDCISQSLLDNLESCQKVIFRIEGEAYKTGHFVFGKDEAYDWK